jgi:hypothetical protein
MDFSCFCSNTLIINPQVWLEFLSGSSVENAKSRLIKSYSEAPKAHIVEAVINAQYHNFEMLESFLRHPKVLLTQLIFKIDDFTKQMLIQTYYRVDKRVIKQLFGKRLSHRVRKELDIISFQTQVSVLGCKRIFDNLKRIYKKVEDSEGDTVAIIMNHFLLSKDLATEYACIIFINNYKFETAKKKLSFLQYNDVVFIASVFMKYLTASPETALIELDSKIVEEAQEIRSRLNNKDVTDKIRVAILKKIGNDPFKDKLGSNIFKNLMKNFIMIAASIINNKTNRDLYLTILEKVVEPCISYNWTAEEFDKFMKHLIEMYFFLTRSSSEHFLKGYPNFQKFLVGLGLSALRIHQAIQ